MPSNQSRSSPTIITFSDSPQRGPFYPGRIKIEIHPDPINELFDQSKLVTQSIAGVLREGAIAAGLTGLMILLFLGSWRSTLIVLNSIPLSILTSIVILYFMGHTLNTMTLGGVDDRGNIKSRECRPRGLIRSTTD
jgi:hypothetical protein